LGCDRPAALVPSNRRYMAHAALVLALSVQAGFTQSRFWGTYAEACRRDPSAWEFGFEDAVRFVEKNRKPDEVCVVGGRVAFPEATVRFVTLPDPRRIQAGEGIPGYRFVETGEPIEAGALEAPGLFLVRPGELRSGEGVEELVPEDSNARFRDFWRVYRNDGNPGG